MRVDRVEFQEAMRPGKPSASAAEVLDSIRRISPLKEEEWSDGDIFWHDDVILVRKIDTAWIKEIDSIITQVMSGDVISELNIHKHSFDDLPQMCWSDDQFFVKISSAKSFCDLPKFTNDFCGFWVMTHEKLGAPPSIIPIRGLVVQRSASMTNDGTILRTRIRFDPKATVRVFRRSWE